MEEKKIIKIPVIDLETGELIEMEIEQECLDAMDAADAEIEKKLNAALLRELEEIQFDRD